MIKGLNIALRLLGCFIAFDIIGIVAWAVLDILPIKGITTFLAYTVWFVVGVFCGAHGYNFAGAAGPNSPGKEWAGRPDSGKTGLAVVAIAFVLVGALSALFYTTLWKSGGGKDFFVPDHLWVSVTFFVAILGMMVVTHTIFRPSTMPKG
jgi:H+/Cl- antiporter ClcA